MTRGLGSPLSFLSLLSKIILPARMNEGGTNANEEAVVELSEEIVVEILLRLPVKSLLAFKRVCKSWYYILSSDRFIREHLKRAQAASYNHHKKFLGVLVPPREAWTTCVLFKEDSGGVIVAKELDFPTKNLAVPVEKIYVQPCNSCDGLICFKMPDANAILIWNPSLVAEYKVIDSTSFTGFPALGYDPTTNDYKVVHVPRSSVVGFPDKCHFVDCFSLKRNLWTTLRLPKTKDYKIASRKVIYTKNCLHWLARDYHGEEYESYYGIEAIPSFIVYFDLAEDSLNYLNLPPSRARLVVPMNYKESLAIAGGSSDGEQELWVLQDLCGMKSSWIKIFKFSGFRLPLNCCFSTNGELLICKGRGLLIFDTKDGSMKNVVIEGDDIALSEVDCQLILTTPYVESLVSPIRFQLLR